jgi:hypothetical protein
MDLLARRILSYLADNPEANDTPEGIAQWWLLDRQIREQVAAVRQVLAELTAEGWLLASNTVGSGTRYRLNPARREEILELVGEPPP